MTLVLADDVMERYEDQLEFLSRILTERQLAKLDGLVWSAIDDLLRSPGMGGYEDGIQHNTWRYRRWVVKNFKIIYRVDGNKLIVTDIFDARQDPTRMQG